MNVNPGGAKSAPLLKEKAYAAIKQAIMDEEFPPGGFLSEKKLIDYLGMSKTPIKSALDRLESEGFVTVSPKQGVLIRELSVSKARDMFELREAIECFVCARVAGRLRPQALEALRVSLARQREAAEAGDEIAFTREDITFHTLLCASAGNTEFETLMQNYQAHLYRFTLGVLRRVPDRMRAALDDHEAIVELLAAGEAEEASERMRAHLDFGKKVLTG